MPIIIDAEAFLDGRRSASLAPATTADRARLTPGGTWVPIDDVAVGSTVHEVDHFHHTRYETGQVMSMRSLKTARRYDLLITSIHLVRCSDLTPDELAELGHLDRASFDAEFGEALAHRRAWFIRTLPPSPYGTQ